MSVGKLPMPIRAIVPWMGAKRMLGSDIVAELGPHTMYFEPCCGSMAVLFAKAPSQKETVNDLHGDLINLARVLATDWAAEKLYDKLQGVLVCEGLLEEARGELEGGAEEVANLESPIFGSDNRPYARGGYAMHSANIDRAFWYFLASWMCRNGTAGTERVDYQIAVRWTRNGGSPTVRWQNALKSIPAWHERLKNVVILRRDLFDIVDRFEDCTQTAIYADPPYPHETRSGWSEAKGKEHRYVHEFNHGGSATAGGGQLFGEIDDHERLATVLKSYKHARIVVSTYDCPRYRKLYEGWRFVEKTMRKTLTVANRAGVEVGEAPEVLIVNGPSIPLPA